ncbi:hypothetical protein HH214_06210 [Mucilaginibacter robiniae]|uniref:Esterase Ig-like N-terminal domain-containing protein n=1 Tax=Mucilaginibacter robiniae TaxID=2728022 RepID=A0A7L5E4S4_9SPHI|nr:hypothetical protein HH214_06210 [Mucilaginibacter robiniae]
MKCITAITEVFGEGQKVTAAAIEFDEPIKNTSLSAAGFSVEGRTITRIYANTIAAKAAKGKDGRYVMIELSPADASAATYVSGGHTSLLRKAIITAKQLRPVEAANGEQYIPSGAPVQSNQQINLVVDDFSQLAFKDPKTGRTLNYNLFIPKNYDARKAYPLVLFMHDAGEVGAEVKAPLVQGLGAVIWATPSEQAKHEAFVLAPQYSSVVVNDQSEATEDLDVTVNLLHELTGRYSIDKDRLYTTGQSMGCMMSIAMDIKYPELFAASFLVAGQWDPAKVGLMANDHLWIVVSQGDTKAFPGMNAITAALEEKGAKVSRATWSGRATANEFAADVKAMEAQGTSINYAALQNGTVIPAGVTDNGGGNHRGTWRIAYTIEGIRDWLFRQRK